MKHYNITIASKNKKSLDAFLRFLGDNLDLNFNLINKYFEKKKQRKILTILKSPHVNKTAQEQFESKIFSKQLTLYVPKHFQCLLFFKNIRTVFTDIKIKIKFIQNKNSMKNKQIYIFNIKNFKSELLSNPSYHNKNLRELKQDKIKSYCDNKSNILQQVEQSIKIADIYGELYLT
jgi:ribosomal protein S10